MYRPDEGYEHEASSADLLTELLLPVYLAAWAKSSARSEQLRSNVTSGDEIESEGDHGVGDEADPGDATSLTSWALSIWLRGLVADRRFCTGTMSRRLEWIASRGVGKRRLRDASAGRVLLASRQSQDDGRCARCCAVVSSLKNSELEQRYLGSLCAAWSAATTPVRPVVCGTSFPDLVRATSD
jgi:hypothetical protein